MNEIILNEESFQSVDGVHAFLARELDFPAYYGANLDALNDCLEDIDSPTAFTVQLAAATTDADLGAWFPKLVRCLLRAARENAAIEVVVHAESFDALARLAACPGLPELLQDDAFITQAVIACLE